MGRWEGGKVGRWEGGNVVSSRQTLLIIIKGCGCSRADIEPSLTFQVVAKRPGPKCFIKLISSVVYECS